ncbi:response regulator transcription factor [Streptomyces sp. NPDC001822]|uniref:response regulator transcription factor n=1 Tax=Streptomyces sp. NPDC001822 TaxID=3364614 RepID=UPI0036861131
MTSPPLSPVPAGEASPAPPETATHRGRSHPGSCCATGCGVTADTAACAWPPARSYVLVVDDDPTVAETVTEHLTRAGYEVALAATGPAALAQYAARRPALAVLDPLLPGLDGFEVCRLIRQHGPPLPIIMLTALDTESDRLRGLEAGADDYVTKPFSPRELVLRVNAVLRRVGAAATSPRRPALLSTGELVLDPTARHATLRGHALTLTAREFDLLEFLVRHPGQAFTRQELMCGVWGWTFGDLSTVTVHIRRLRGKVESDPAHPELIRTIWGVGYRLDSTTTITPRIASATENRGGCPSKG